MTNEQKYRQALELIVQEANFDEETSGAMDLGESLVRIEEMAKKALNRSLSDALAVSK